MTIVLIVQYPASRRYLRGSGVIIQVQEDDGPGRSPKSTDPDGAGRYLESRGYQFIAAESIWLDKPGTFRRRRKQVFCREEVPA